MACGQYFEVFSAWVLWIRVGPSYSDSARQARHFYRSHDHIRKIFFIAQYYVIIAQSMLTIIKSMRTAIKSMRTYADKVRTYADWLRTPCGRLRTSLKGLRTA